MNLMDAELTQCLCNISDHTSGLTHSIYTTRIGEELPSDNNTTRGSESARNTTYLICGRGEAFALRYVRP